jgi:uncharacterized protein (TIGR00251 family)
VIALSPTPDGITFAVRVIPRAGRTAIAGVRGDALLVRLAAAPVEGAANAALLEALAGALRVPARAVTLVTGQRSRDKVVRISGLSVEDLATRLNGILGE